MFLRNYDNHALVRDGMLDGNYRSKDDYEYVDHGSTSTNLKGEGEINAVNSKGVITTIYTRIGSSNYTGSVALHKLNAKQIVLGTGTTPVTYDDYKMSGDIIPNKLSFVSSTLTYNESTHKWTKKNIYAYDNSANTSDVVINEWGYFYHNYYGSSFSDYSWGDSSNSTAGNSEILLYREVLDTPITIKAGEAGTIALSIEVPMPNHP